MNKISIVEIDHKKEINKFIQVPWDIYKNDSNWVPPLKIAVKELFKPKHPFLKLVRFNYFLPIEIMRCWPNWRYY